MRVEIHVLLYAAVGLYALSLWLSFRNRVRGARVILWSGFLLHGAYLCSRAWMTGAFVSSSMLDGEFLMPWALALLALLQGRRASASSTIPSALFLALAFGILASLYPKGIMHLGPNKLSAWANMYFFTDTLGRACFYAGAITAVFTLRGRGEASSWHSFFVWGFVLYTVAQVSGAIWCFLGWAATFKWVEVHMQSAAIWCCFATYLHLPFLPEWNERRRAGFGMVGSFVVLAFHLHAYALHYSMPRI